MPQEKTTILAQKLAFINGGKRVAAIPLNAVKKIDTSHPTAYKYIKYCHPSTMADTCKRCLFTAKGLYGERFCPNKGGFLSRFSEKATSPVKYIPTMAGTLVLSRPFRS